MKFRIVLAVVVTALLGASLMFSAPIEQALGFAPVVESADFESDSSMADSVEVVREGEAVLHFIDVGQGDATLIELPSETEETDDGGAIEGTFILIDGGSDSSSYQARAADGNLKLLNYLDERVGGITDFVFDYVILTHPHEDHCGGLNDVLNKYPSKVVYRPNARSVRDNSTDPILENAAKLTDDEVFFGTHNSARAINTKTYYDFLSAAYNSRFNANGVTKKVYVSNAQNAQTNSIEGSAVYENGVKQTINEGNSEYFKLKFHTPTKAEYTNVNDYSPIITLDFNDKRVVLTGDAESEAEQEFYNLYAASSEFYKKADIVVAGHHGSRTSTSANLLDVVAPKGTNQSALFVISCGLNNSYNHPHTELMSRVQDYGFKEENILRTDVNGDIVISFVPDPEGAGYVMMFGASVIRTVKDPVVPLKWWQVAVGIWVVLMIIIFALGNSKLTKSLSDVAEGFGVDTSAVKTANKAHKKAKSAKNTIKKSTSGKKTTTSKKPTSKKTTSKKSTQKGKK